MALIGRVGSGKSTLQRLMLGLYRPKQGAVLLDGIDLSQLDPADLRKNLGYVSQDLAMGRGEDGQVRMLDAYWKHLGAHMGHGGKVHGNLLECPFHAWRYDGDDGAVKDIPYARVIPPQVKRKCTRTYWSTQEFNYRARGLYDQVATKSPFLQYRR